MSEILILSLTAGSIAVVHTLLGPDHYLPFVAMAKSRGWSMAKTLRMTLLCGLGHISGSIILGVVGVMLGSQLASLTWVEGVRGDLAAWGLMALGLVYLLWGLRRAYRHKQDDIAHGVLHGHHHIGGHAHHHFHDGHWHGHGHTHEHKNADHEATAVRKAPTAYWALFLVFVLGPCEPLIPLLMYPAAVGNVWAAIMVCAVFGIATVVTMVFAVLISVWGLSFVKMPNIERYSHALAGSTILMCGAGMVFFGL